MFDAIVVFGGGINLDGTLVDNSRARAEKGVSLWKDGLAPIIVMSGAWPYSRKKIPLQTEAKAMATLAESLGCPNEKIFLEEESKDTIGNAFFVKRLFALPRRWKQLIIVVADYHVNRTREVCRVIFGPTFVLRIEGATIEMPIQARQERDLREKAIVGLFKDWFDVEPGDDRAIEKVLKTLHPGYSSSPHYSTDEVQQRISERVEKLRAQK